MTERSSIRWLARLVQAGAMLCLGAQMAAALCDVEYRVQPGDTLAGIAERHYGARSHWGALLAANSERLAGAKVKPGMMLHVPCLSDAADARAGTAPPERQEVEINVLAIGGPGPFVGRGLPEMGLIPELVTTALELSPSPVSHAVSIGDDPGQQIELLASATFDMGVPHARPDCEATPGDRLCRGFHFSDPLIELPMMLFVRADRQFPFRGDADLQGKALCRPEGAITHDLDAGARGLIADGRITLVTAPGAEACLDKVLTGEVDAASLDLFTGGSLLLDKGWRDRIVPLERPVSVVGLHVIISKSHWRGTTHLYRLNAGIARLRQEGRYDEIVARHLDLLTSQF
jgi:polar amino acid transport system substrate-binding protein